MNSLIEKIFVSPGLKYRIARHILFWIFILLICFTVGIPYVKALKLVEFDNFSGLFNTYIRDITLFDVPLVYFVIYFLFPRFYFSDRAYFIFLLAITYLIGNMTYMLWGIYDHDGRSDHFLFYSFIKFKNYLVYSGASLVVFASLRILKEWYINEKKYQKIIQLNTESKIQLLKYRIQPHFLFNTLNTIYSSILFDSERASVSLLQKLYNIMNYTVHECNEDTILLQKEIDSISDYVSLESSRYKQRLSASMHFAGDFHDKIAHPLILQPFVENAFKHGVAKSSKHAWIKLAISENSGILQMNISNSMETQNISDHEGIGIENVKKRMDLIFGSKYKLNTIKNSDHYSVHLEFPISYRLNKKG